MSERTCPSGMRLEIRGLKGKEMAILEDREAVRRGTFVDKLLGACVVRVVELGPYTFDPAKGVPWDEVLLGDKFYALLSVRSETFGPEFGFSVKCGSCRHPYRWELSLDELPVKPLAGEDAAAFRAGEALATKVPSDGKLVKFRLPTGKDERLAAKSKTVDSALIAMMARRILSVEGVPEGGVRAYLEEAGLRDLTKLLREFDRRDCGVETSIEIECPSCQAREEITLPLDREFWLPK